MAFEAAKSVVQRLFADGAFRETFLTKPEEILNKVAVSSEERRSLLHLRTRLATNGPTLNSPEWP